MMNSLRKLTHPCLKVGCRLFSTTPKPNIAGVYTPIITPFDENGELELDHLRKNIATWAKTKLNGLVVLGSNGEFALLSKEEKLKVLQTAIDASKENGGKLKMIAGTGAVSTKETIELTRAAADMGYYAAMVVTPYYFTTRMTPAVLKSHFTTVASSSTIPIILYNVPPFTGITIPVDLICELSHVKNIIGVKDTTGSIAAISETSRKAAPGFAVLAGSGGYLLQSMVSGASGGVMALANILPEQCCRLYSQLVGGSHSEAIGLQKQLVTVNDVATAKFGVGGLKYAMDHLGYYGGKPRAPLPNVTEEQAAQIRDVLSDFRSK